MTALATVLLTVGLAAAGAPMAGRSARLRALVLFVCVGIGVGVPLLLGAGLDTLWIAALAIVVATLWEMGTRRNNLWGSSAVAVGAIACIAVSPLTQSRGSVLRGWYTALDIPGLAAVPIDRAALALGVLVFLGAASNEIVRQVLAASGPAVLAQEQSFQGGRVLGPLERWLIFAFALSGSFAALAAIVAAKGILRFPEISRDSPGGAGAEYVLVGSFVSWALAALFVPLL